MKQGEAVVSSKNMPVVPPASYKRQHLARHKNAKVEVTYRLDSKLSFGPDQSWRTHLPLELRIAGPAKPKPLAYIHRVPTRVVRSARKATGQENAGIGVRSKAKKL
jgi:hypothetical protein